MKKPYLITTSLLTLGVVTGIYAQSVGATGTIVDKMKAVAHSFTLAATLNPSDTGLTSDPVKGKKTGDILTAGEWNRILELVNEGGGSGSGMGNSVIFCNRKNSTYAPLNGQQLVKFTASDCGGTLPDSSYHGALASLNVCNGAIDHTVYDGGTTNGPGVSFSFRGGSACTWPDGTGYNISVVYMKSDGGGNNSNTKAKVYTVPLATLRQYLAPGAAYDTVNTCSGMWSSGNWKDVLLMNTAVSRWCRQVCTTSFMQANPNNCLSVNASPNPDQTHIAGVWSECDSINNATLVTCF